MVDCMNSALEKQVLTLTGGELWERKDVLPG
jgi:hypothetical protein